MLTSEVRINQSLSHSLCMIGDCEEAGASLPVHLEHCDHYVDSLKTIHDGSVNNKCFTEIINKLSKITKIQCCY